VISISAFGLTIHIQMLHLISLHHALQKTERVDDWLINEMLRAVSLSLVKASPFVFISAEFNLTLLGLNTHKSLMILVS
jgi:hypothetical protein